ncbi:FAD-dependent oxidoreductase [Bradyrhizobium sp. LHD-71]|uniref:NAD(P)/FAD-dependent oxidoreductase n=1 Tax=Bradyrhizobium sp. LHD-71 TaxID=3072141 RepID=UPI00280D8130|nr:FAD-dependent oxidoreductase [Bradyrhizobium sp. LHD-71]MDQ8728915.1 FAD-dependent oxidoreductase [Bradyrhizobium sp. LHD-71]
MSEPLVVIGNGMAAARLAQEIAKRALGRYAVAIIGDEPRLAYNRVLLSSVLAGEIASKEIELQPAAWWRDRGVTLSYGRAATSVDLQSRRVVLADGRLVPFSKLVFATGSQPLRLNIPGADLPGVHTFRDSRDVDLLLTLAAARRRVVVIGGGLLGLEAAYGLAKAGSPVTLVHLMDRLMERQLDAPAAALLKRLVEEKGIDIRLNASTKAIFGGDTVRGIELADGTHIAADAVIFAAGIRPNAGLAEAAGIAVNRGIVVDGSLATNVAGVYALGECAEHRGVCYGLVEPAYEQAKVLAEHLAGRSASYEGSVLSTNLKVSGVNVFSAGDFAGAAGTEAIVLSDARQGTYKKLVISGGRLTGAILIGDTQDALWYLELIRSAASVTAFRSDLMFGRALAERKAA